MVDIRKSYTPVQRPSFVALSMQELQTFRLANAADNFSKNLVPGGRGTSVTSGEVIQQTQITNPDQTSGTPISGGTGVSYTTVYGLAENESEGPFQPTGNPTDLKIEGKGFFGLEGGYLTRNGRLHLNTDGTVMINNQQVLNSGGGNIRVSEPIQAILSDGTIVGKTGKTFGPIGVFEEPSDRVSVGNGLYKTNQDIEPLLIPKVMNGGYEGFNGSPIQSMIEVIQATRAYQQATDLIKAEEEVIQTITGLSKT